MIARVWIVCLLFALLALPIHAFDDQTLCYKELQREFFRGDLVRQALSLYDVQESQWEIILVDLRDRAKTIPDRIKRRAMHMRPDPLQYPFDTKGARDLLYQTLIEVFMETLHANSIISEADIHDMFNYIFERQLDRWEACLGKTRKDDESVREHRREPLPRPLYPDRYQGPIHSEPLERSRLYY